MEKTKKSEGITLVALIVTIVVLLILAGITISYIIGDNSVFKKAADAKLQADIAQWKERLELAKNPVFIEGLGTFDVDKYFDYIENQGIIEDKEIDVIDNEDGTYDVTTRPGYIFLVTLMPTPEKPIDAEIEYMGQAGKVPPIIKRLEVSATSTSITGKAIVSRLGNGTIKYYYKLKTESADEYKEITNVNTETGATQSTGIIAGIEYVIKVVAKNDVGEVEKTAEITATKITVESIILNKTTETVATGKTVTLTASVKPDDATNKNVTWESSNTAVATVSDTGIVTGKTAGTATITVKATDGSDKIATCTVIVKSISLNKATQRVAETETVQLTATILPDNVSNKNVSWSSSNTAIATVNSNGVVTGVAKGTVTITVSTTDASKATATCTISVVDIWEKLNRVAKAIANDSKITNTSVQATGVTEAGETYNIKVGDIFNVQYGRVNRRVRVLGFKHDDLVNKNVYGGNHNKAGISFEFMDVIETTQPMNMSATNVGGWAATQMRKDLNGYSSTNDIQSGNIGGLGNKMSNKDYIKQVSKTYAPTYNSSDTRMCNDYLWLLSFAEITSSKREDTAAGFTIAKEGNEYQWYKQNEGVFKTRSLKYDGGASVIWWLRSPFMGNDTIKSTHFCYVNNGDFSSGSWASANDRFIGFGVPGFCI
ncbi:MAG: hypothetical protein HFJ29_08185 [Clostridia bacterium]|nr:hypothetical protein [Clostridia bacterium]